MQFKSFRLMGIIAAISLAPAFGSIGKARTEQKTTEISRSTSQRSSEAVAQVDRDFAKMAADRGMTEAFSYFAADSATMLRRGSEPIVGREAIRSLFEGETESALRWSPYFADMASSNDLGYTLGTSQYVYKDSTGAQKISYGY